MTSLLQIDFPHDGPFGDELAAAMRELAASINDEPGFIWKLWTTNQATREAGGIYLFSDQASAEAYLAKHVARLEGFGYRDIRAKVFAVNGPLSQLNRAPIE
jgi:hypothetical protein